MPKDVLLVFILLRQQKMVIRIQKFLKIRMMTESFEYLNVYRIPLNLKIIIKQPRGQLLWLPYILPSAVQTSIREMRKVGCLVLDMYV